MLMRVVPYASISYTMFDKYEDLLVGSFGQEKDWKSRFIAGSSAGATATAVNHAGRPAFIWK